jgi:hypothetical protein
MGTKMTKTKAIAAGVVTTVTTFLTSLTVALNDGVVTQAEWLTIAVATVGAAGAAFGVTYAAPANKPVES